MKETQFIPDQRVIECIKKNYGIEVAKLTSVPLGADMNARVYKAEAKDMSSFFVKLKRGHCQDIGVTVLDLLHKAGIEQIIPPVKTNEGQLNQLMEEYTLIVYPFIDGQDGFSRSLTNEQFTILGKIMRQVHEICLPRSVQDRVRRETFSPQWRQAVRNLYSFIEAEPEGDKIASELQSFMQAKKTTIERLVERAEQLCEMVLDQSTEFVLCHSDIHGGNVLIERTGKIFIVDWDEPILAPKERDLMFIGGGIANVWNKAHGEEYFYKGYGATEVNRIILAYYRHERIVEDLALYGQQILFSKTGEQDRLQAYEYFVSYFVPGSALEIAFRTDDDLNIL